MDKRNKLDDNVVIHFNRNVDTILAGHEPHKVENDDVQADMLKISKILASADLGTLSHNRNKSWQQVANQSQKTLLHRRLTSAVASLALIFTLIFAFTATPLQAWAQTVLARIGAITITDKSEWTEEQLREVNDHSDNQERPVGQLSQEDASARARFDVLMPTYIPKGFKWRSTDVDTDIRDTTAVYVSTSYDGSGVLMILQWKMPVEMKSDLKIGDSAMTEVTIRGNKGYSIENVGWSAVGSGYSWKPGNDNAIIWEEDGIIYQIYSGGASIADFKALSVSELLKIAESLKP